MYMALTLEAEFLVFSEYVVMPREIHIICQLNDFFCFTLQVIIKSKKAGVNLELNPPLFSTCKCS